MSNLHMIFISRKQSGYTLNNNEQQMNKWQKYVWVGEGREKEGGGGGRYK